MQILTELPLEVDLDDEPCTRLIPVLGQRILIRPAQQNVQGQQEPPVVEMQPEPQPAPDGDTLSIVGSLSEHGSAASAKLHEEIDAHRANNTAPLHWVQFNCRHVQPEQHRLRASHQAQAVEARLKTGGCKNEVRHC